MPVPGDPQDDDILPCGDEVEGLRTSLAHRQVGAREFRGVARQDHLEA